MIARAKTRFIRTSPRKLRQIVNVVRHKSVFEALAILANLNKRAAVYVEETVKSAMSNAKRDPAVKDENLYISKLIVDGGPMLKRFRAASMGRATTIRHRTSHITVELDLRPEKIVKKQQQAPLKKRRVREKEKKIPAIKK